MSDAPEVPYRAAGKRRAPTPTSHVVAKVLLSSMMALALLTGLSVTLVYRHLDGNLNYQSFEDLLPNRPDEVDVEGPKQPINILVMGSDTREGDGNAIDGEATGAGLSDTTILLHLSADRQSAYGISIPRDTLVDRPDCLTEDGGTIPGGSVQQWNAAYALGGPSCTINQFEALTGIFIHNYVVVDFAGFRNMVDALGGVEVCVPQEIDDSVANITIPAGTRTIDGDEALSYVRVRYGVGDGSDIGRIKRQQAFVASMANKVLSGSILARPDYLVRFLSAATDSLTTDIENLGRLGRIGLEFRGIGLKRIQFITVPFTYSTAYPGRVELLPEAEGLWEKVRNDAPLGAFRGDAISADGALGGKDKPSQSPSPDPTGAPNSPGASPSDSAAAEAAAAEAAAKREAVGLCA
jgi:LCP family protein required for cell wall assembly